MQKREHHNSQKRTRRGSGRPKPRRRKQDRKITAKVHPALKNTLKQIGTPRKVPFKPDDFQLEALKKLRTADVLVSTPTGTGKTWIALEAIKRYVQQGKRSWYTAPLKALSNAKYQEFCEELGAGYVGIVTGDRKENPDAPVIVGTTEILRNQLYDGMYLGSDINVDFVVLDEAHYLNDYERGVVWEEILIYLPHRVKILLLSATFRNADEIAQWLSETRKVPCSVVTLDKRLVPLVPLFLFPQGLLAPLSDGKGLFPQVKEFMRITPRPSRYRRALKPDYGRIVEQLRANNLLPAIFFLKSRSDCDAAVEGCVSAKKSVPPDDDIFQTVLKQFLEEHPILRQNRQLSELVRYRVGAHHGGQLPQWKLLIEKMMNLGCVDAIFSTSTVAAGVDFPARTVVLVQSDRYNGLEFTDLTATELHQMTGRAGRRGKDKIGFALVVPGVFQDPALINKLLASPPEPIRSQIQANFSMALNLLLSYRPPEIRELLDRSLATFQSTQPLVILEKSLEEYIDEISAILEDCHKGRHDKETVRLFVAELRRVDRKGGTPCAFCTELSHCKDQKRRRVKNLAARIRKIARRVDRERHKLWIDFERHLSFLKESGFVTPDDYLSADGMWASQLRIDQPVLIADCIRQKVFDEYSPEILAGLIASFVNDKAKTVEVSLNRIPQAQALISAFETMVVRLKPLRRAMMAQGFSLPSLQLWPSVAVYIWSRGASWFDVLELVDIEEGDLAMLVLRTADHLRQVRNLEASHPALAQKAHQVLPVMLREPVWGY